MHLALALTLTDLPNKTESSSLLQQQCTGTGKVKKRCSLRCCYKYTAMVTLIFKRCVIGGIGKYISGLQEAKNVFPEES